MKPGADPDLLQRISGAVADGEDIDWEAAARRLSRKHEGTLAGLRLVSRVSSTRPQGAADDRDLVPGVPPWLLVLAGFVVVQLVLGARGLAIAGAEPVGGLLQVATAWAFGLGALLLVQRPPVDRRCLALAGVFLGIAGASTQQLTLGGARAIGGLLLQGLALPLPECLLPLFLWWFARLFPRTRAASRLDRLAGVGARVAAAAAGLLATARLASLAGHDWLPRNGGVHWPLLLGLCLPALVVMWLRRRVAPTEERRRVVFFVAGIAVGLTPLIAMVLADAVVPAVSRLLNAPGATSAIAAGVYACLLTIPLTTAHAAGSARLVSVPSLVRAAAQRALGRAALGSLLALACLLLAFRLWQSRHDSLASLAADPLAVLLVIAAVGAIVLLRWRRGLAASLGLRPRETWNERIASIGGRIHASRPDLLAEVVERALGEFLDTGVKLLMKRPDGSLADRGGQLPPLSPGHALGLLCFQSRTPLDVGPDSGLFACLPAPDRDWVVLARAHRVVPIQGVTGALGLLVLQAGAAGDLDREDLHGLEALAATLALALEAGRAAPVESASLECSDCGAVFEGEPRCECQATAFPATIPRLLNGKFEVERRLGQGGMGVVYLARDLELDRAVALKTLPRLSGEAARRLRSEARAMALVRHPNVAQIHGLETWGGAPVVVLEYLPGGTLAGRLSGPLSPAASLDLAIGLAAGLAAVHDAGLLHRDVKPSNVGFDAGGIPRLLDFGLSRLSPEAATAVAGPDVLLAWAGTPLYMSPSVLAGAEPGPADDVWSLLVVLRECLAGRHPLRGLSRDDLLPALQRGFPDLRPEHPGIPPLIAERLHRWLVPEGVRPASARELRAELLALRTLA